MFDALPAETHPAWELAIESVLFGGEGLAPEVVPYGEQQAKKNDFRMAAYRTRYGDGDRVTEFPTLPTKLPSEQDHQYIDEEIQLPVSPDSETVLPLFVDDDTLPEAVGLLNELPTKPGDKTNESSNSNLLNPDLFPGLTTSTSSQTATDDGRDTGQLSTHQTDIPPNELADLYDGLYTLLESLPDDTNPRWQEAIESVLFGGAYLDSEASPYGKQQAERNEFGMPDYRSKYGNGDHVTEFPAIATKRPAGDDTQYVDDSVELPIAPNTQTVLPLRPAEEALPDAAQLLAEFPAAPDAEAVKQGADANALFDIDAFLRDIDSGVQPNNEDSSTDSQPELASGSGETDGSNLKSRGATSSVASDLSRQEQERLEDIIDLAPTSNRELASCWDMDTTKEAWKFLSEHLDGYYQRNENNRIEPTEEAIQICSASRFELSQQEKERLKDIIDLAPTSNGELASAWDLDTTKEVWEYLTEHLDDYYHRNENSRIEPTEEGIRIETQTDARDLSTDSQPEWVPDSSHDGSSSQTGAENRTYKRSQSGSTAETNAETESKNPKSHSVDSPARSKLSTQEQKRLEDIIDLAPTSNGELASSWGLDTTREVWEYLTEHLDDYYYRNENSRIEPTEEGIQINTQTDAEYSSTDSKPEWVPGSNHDDSASRTGTETRTEQSQTTATTETESGTGQDDSPCRTNTETRSEPSQSTATAETESGTDETDSVRHTETQDEETQLASTTETEVETDGDKSESPSADSTVLRQESAGKSTVPLDQQHESDSDSSKKYDDPQAERAHRRAQQRDPSDVVELGEEIKLTIKQVDYSSRPPTIMGTKNRLVVFIIDAPQDLSEYETIKATVVDYGGKNNSAEAAFSGYVN